MRNAGTIYIGIHQSDLAAGPGKTIGQISGHGTFAHAAFSRPNGNHAFGGQADFADLFRLSLVDGKIDSDF